MLRWAAAPSERGADQADVASRAASHWSARRGARRRPARTLPASTAAARWGMWWRARSTTACSRRKKGAPSTRTSPSGRRAAAARKATRTPRAVRTRGATCSDGPERPVAAAGAEVVSVDAARLDARARRAATPARAARATRRRRRRPVMNAEPEGPSSASQPAPAKQGVAVTAVHAPRRLSSRRVGRPHDTAATFTRLRSRRSAARAVVAASCSAPHRRARQVARATASTTRFCSSSASSCSRARPDGGGATGGRGRGRRQALRRAGDAGGAGVGSHGCSTFRSRARRARGSLTAHLVKRPTRGDTGADGLAARCAAPSSPALVQRGKRRPLRSRAR